MHLDPIGRDKPVRDFQSSPLSIVPLRWRRISIILEVALEDHRSWAPTMFRATSKFVMRSQQWRRRYTLSLGPGVPPVSINEHDLGGFGRHLPFKPSLVPLRPFQNAKSWSCG